MANNQPKIPLGTMVRGKLDGWDAVQADSYDDSYEKGLDILPSYEDCPEIVEGKLDGFYVDEFDYYKYIVEGYDVDPDSLEEIDEESEIASAFARKSKKKDTKELAEFDRDLRTRIHQGANDAMFRALEKCGAKIRTKMSRTINGRTFLADKTDVPNHILPRITPKSLIAASGLEEQLIIMEAWDELHSLWNSWLDVGGNQVLRKTAKILDIDVNTIFGARERLEEAAIFGWDTLQSELTSVANGYLGDSIEGVVEEIEARNLVDQGIVRRAIARAAGEDSTSAGIGIGANMEVGTLPQLSTGPIVTDIMRENDQEIATYTWVHGFTPDPFIPHQQLNGYEFKDWSDPGLSNPNSFPNLEYYTPGDHDGCSCDFYIGWQPYVNISITPIGAEQ